MKRLLAPLLVLITAAIAAIVGAPGGASAHPLGNFTINHSTTIEISETGVTVYRVLDLAEIPAFQALQQLPKDANGDTVLEGWAADQAAAIGERLTVSINGEPVELRASTHDPSLVDGQGGLQILRLDVVYHADLANGVTERGTLAYTDSNYTDRIGWREVIVRGGPGVDLVNSALPTESATDSLRVYPEAGFSSPPDIREVSVSFRPGVGLPAIAPSQSASSESDLATRGNPDGALAGFTKLISEDELSAGFIVFALLAAVAFGAIHALSPGHGKTVVAAYLVGSRGTLLHAALLGLVVTVTHTSSVYALGFVTLYLSQFIVPEDLYPWMSAMSGAIILTMGMLLFVGRIRASSLLPRVFAWRPPGHISSQSEVGSLRFAAASATRTDADDGHTHDQSVALGHTYPHHQDHHPASHSVMNIDTHSHGFGSHTHAVPGADGEAVTWQRLVGLGVFGGMIPCPSAIVVMLSAIALHRVGFGLLLIVAFSVGLATVLTGIGFAVVWAQRLPRLQRLMDRAEHSNGMTAVVVRGVPIAAAALVCVVGAVLFTRALWQF